MNLYDMMYVLAHFLVSFVICSHLSNFCPGFDVILLFITQIQGNIKLPQKNN